MTTSPISFRPDAEARAALDEINDDYDSPTQILKAGILLLAEQKRSAALRAESLAAANDPDDLAETKAAMRDMEPLRAW